MDNPREALSAVGCAESMPERAGGSCIVTTFSCKILALSFLRASSTVQKPVKAWID